MPPDQSSQHSPQSARSSHRPTPTLTCPPKAPNIPRPPAPCPSAPPSRISTRLQSVPPIQSISARIPTLSNTLSSTQQHPQQHPQPHSPQPAHPQPPRHKHPTQTSPPKPTRLTKAANTHTSPHSPATLTPIRPLKPPPDTHPNLPATSARPKRLPSHSMPRSKGAATHSDFSRFHMQFFPIRRNRLPNDRNAYPHPGTTISQTNRNMAQHLQKRLKLSNLQPKTMIVGYIRVSTAKQHPENQKEEICRSQQPPH